jgi:hypothetical protein
MKKFAELDRMQASASTDAPLDLEEVFRQTSAFTVQGATAGGDDTGVTPESEDETEYDRWWWLMHSTYHQTWEIAKNEDSCLRVRKPRAINRQSLIARYVHP